MLSEACLDTWFHEIFFIRTPWIIQSKKYYFLLLLPFFPSYHAPSPTILSWNLMMITLKSNLARDPQAGKAANRGTQTGPQDSWLFRKLESKLPSHVDSCTSQSIGVTIRHPASLSGLHLCSLFGKAMWEHSKMFFTSFTSLYLSATFNYCCRIR